MGKQISEENLNKFFYVLIAIIIFFTTSDLVFGFSGMTIVAACCSLVSAFLVFWGYFKVQKVKVEVGIDTVTKFINSNFNKFQIVLSVLDVVCSIIVVITSILAFGVFFRTMILTKILFTPTRLITISNKFNTITKPLLVFCFCWVYLRVKNRIKERKMSNIKLSKAQIIFMGVAFGLGVLYSILSATCLPQIAFSSDALTQVATSLGGTAGMILGAFLKGKEMTEEEIAARDKKLAEKEQEKAEKAKVKAEAAEQAKLEADKKAALALLEKKKAEQAKLEADKEREQYLLELAQKVEQEEKEKAQVEQNTNAS